MEIKKKDLELLERISKTLKREFIGIDHIINRIMGDIQSWYLLPEVFDKPLIINLWGMTGTGKTSLVRRLVQLLKMEKDYKELDLSTYQGRQRYTYDSIGMSLKNVSNKRSIILLDEFQQAQSKDSDGNPIQASSYQDVWSILSDGKVVLDINIEEAINSFYKHQMSLNAKDAKEAKVTQWDFNRILKFIATKEERLVILQEFVENPAKSIKKIIKLAEKFENQVTLDFSKSLIFISGNLDDMYKNRVHVLDPDSVEADELHQDSLQLNNNNVKKALDKLFRPEQISRLGNNHVIYPCFSQKSYEKFIKLQLKLIKKRFKKSTGFIFDFDKSIVSKIYTEGVIPSQGARPTISTIKTLIESHLPKIVLEARINKNSQNIKINIDPQGEKLTAKGNKIKMEIPISLPIYKHKNTPHKEPMLSQVAYHEAGHAIVGYYVFNKLPSKIVSKTSMVGAGGYVKYNFDPDKITRKKDLLNILAFSLGGYAAEELIFGKDNISIGSSGDIESATRQARQMVTTFGFGSHFGNTETKNHNIGDTNRSFAEKDDVEIEVLLKESYEVACRILKKQEKLHHQLAEALKKASSVSPVEFNKLIKKFGIK